MKKKLEKFFNLTKLEPKKEAKILIRLSPFLANKKLAKIMENSFSTKISLKRVGLKLMIPWKNTVTGLIHSKTWPSKMTGSYREGL